MECAIAVYGYLLDIGILEICVKGMVGKVHQGTRNSGKVLGL